MKQNHWNNKVSKNRGEKWKESIVQGRLDASINPSKLKFKRVSLGMSQTDIANQVGLSLATYGAIERGKRRLKKTVADKITKILKVNTGDIFKNLPKGKLEAKK